MPRIPISTGEPAPCPRPGPLFALGFRPFFLAAGVFSVAAIVLWTAITLGVAALPADGLPAMAWHGHEMLYGYAMAVIAGFLLTASRNWSGLPTLNGWPLLALCLAWGLARLLPLLPFSWALPAMAACDLAFDLGTALAVLQPLARARLREQYGLWSKLVFLLAGNVAFYLGLFGLVDDGIRIGLFSGLYLALSLILTLARRLLPFFVGRTLRMDPNGGDTFEPVNTRWLDVAVIALMIALLICDVFIVSDPATATIAAILGGLHLVRLRGWYHPVVRRHPLLWVLFAGYAWIVAGFFVLALTPFFPDWRMLAVHAFAYGGIGLVTLGMMARVALGHTGRDVHRPPTAIRAAFVLLVAGAACRVAPPMFGDWGGDVWLVASQIAWIAAFAIFVRDYAPILMRPRLDGRPG